MLFLAMCFSYWIEQFNLRNRNFLEVCVHNRSTLTSKKVLAHNSQMFSGTLETRSWLLFCFKLNVLYNLLDKHTMWWWTRRDLDVSWMGWINFTLTYCIYLLKASANDGRGCVNHSHLMIPYYPEKEDRCCDAFVLRSVLTHSPLPCWVIYCHRWTFVCAVHGAERGKSERASTQKWQGAQAT